MEPASLTAAAIATLVIIKAAEKSGEKLGEKVVEAGGKLLSLLKIKAPETAKAIEAAQTQPLDAGQAVLVEQVAEAAKQHPEIAAAVADVAKEAETQIPQTIENWKGINIKGGTNTISGNTFNF